MNSEQPFYIPDQIKNPQNTEHDGKNLEILNEKLYQLQRKFNGVDRLLNRNTPKEDVIFNEKDISFLLEKKETDSLLQCLRIGALNSQQETIVLNQIIQEESTPNKIYFLCEIIGRGNYGERLSPSLVDYVSKSKDLLSNEVMAQKSYQGISFIFEDRSLHQMYSQVPKWASYKIWGSLTKEKSPIVSKFISQLISKQTLDKEFENQGLGYILNNLNFEGILPLLKSLSNPNNKGLIKQDGNIISEKLNKLNSQEITELTDEWWNNNPSRSEIRQNMEFLISDFSFLKKIGKIYHIPLDKKTKTTAIPIKVENKTFYSKSISQLSTFLLPIEGFLNKKLTENNYLDEANNIAHRYLQGNTIHTNDLFEALIETYRNKMPDEAKKFFTSIISLGLENKIKSVIISHGLFTSITRKT